MVITPLDDRIFILPIGVSDKTPGGLFIPEVAQDQSNLKGKVLAAGRGHQNVKGHLLKVEVKVGDEVLFSKHSGSKILLNGLELIVVRESDLLGILES